MDDDKLWDMSDAALDEAFKIAKAEALSSDTTYEEQRETQIVDDLEQPEFEDSDDDADVGDADPETTDDGSDKVGNGLDGDDTAEEENPEAEVKGDEEAAQPVQEKYKFKANGKEYEFSDEEVRKEFPKIFGQAMDYTKKMQAIKPWRKTIDAIEEAKLNHDDVNLMIDVLKGDKDAVATVLKRTGIDALTLDIETSRYVPKDYGRDDKTLAVKDVIDEISTDSEYSTTYKVLSKDWDDRSFQEMTSDPELIRLLHVDVKSGMFNKVQPIAEKLKVYDRGRQSDLDYYKDAARVYFEEQRQVNAQVAETDRLKAIRAADEAERTRIREVKGKQQQQVVTRQDAEKRRAAAPTKRTSGVKQVIDYMDESEEAYNEWYNSVQNKM